MEDLKVQNMMKNHRLSKSFADSALSTLRNFINYKQIEYGMEVQLLGTFEPSTKICSECGHTQTMKLSDRVFKCESCKLEIDRDWNAAINIRNKVVGVNATQQTQRDDKTNLNHMIQIRCLDEVFNILL